MRINDEQPKVESLKPTILILSWFTLCYAMSLVGYIGRSQGLYFWYVSLRRPDWDVPTWAFTPAWTILCAVIGLATWQLWNEPPSRNRGISLLLLLTQLVLSAIEPWVYFAWHQVVLSICLTGVSCLVVLFATIVAWSVKPSSGKTLILYLASVTFFAVLEFTVLQMNR